jgi:integrase
MLPASPCTGVKLPPKSSRKHIYLTASQLGALADESGRYGSLVLLLGIGGLRWGEAAALRVGDIDPLRRRVHLHENAVVIGGTTYAGALKTGKSRDVPIPGFVADAQAFTCTGKGRGELIWTATDGGHLTSPSDKSWLSGAVARCQAADPTFPRITAHDLRHTAASLAISSGANPLVVQRMLGHASAAMTLDVYADLFDSDADTVAQNVGKRGQTWAIAAGPAPQNRPRPAHMVGGRVHPRLLLHYHRVANVDAVVVPLRVFGAEADAAVADILKPERIDGPRS